MLLNQPYDSVSILTLPADHDTWSVVLITGAKDKALRGRAGGWKDGSATLLGYIETVSERALEYGSHVYRASHYSFEPKLSAGSGPPLADIGRSSDGNMSRRPAH